MRLQVYTDGSCFNNPGPNGEAKGDGGWGILIECNGDAETFSGAEKGTTSNRMELMAAIRALEIIPPGMAIDLFTDSNYVKQGITEWLPKWKANGYRTSANKPIKNQDLWMRLDDINRRQDVEWAWVKAHNGNQGNEIVDMLANKAARSLS